MSVDNPFAVSSGSFGDRSGRDRDVIVAEVSTRTVEILNQTRPWVRLMGVLLWIGTVFLGIATVIALAAGLFSQNFFLVGASLAYILMTAVYFTLARSLTTYASKINLLNASENVKDLEDALDAQKTFWRLVGIITVTIIIIYVVILVLAVSGGFMFSNLNPR